MREKNLLIFGSPGSRNSFIFLSRPKTLEAWSPEDGKCPVRAEHGDCVIVLPATHYAVRCEYRKEDGSMAALMSVTYGQFWTYAKPDLGVLNEVVGRDAH
jgi:hypothetical protein